MTQKDYDGRDLEAMSFAVNYHRWILNVFKPHLGNNVIEVGAGTGLFSELLLEQSLASLTLVEPSAEMHAILKDRLDRLNPPHPTEIHNCSFEQIVDRIRNQTDSIVYVNVLEHIQDDLRELQLANHVLVTGGRLFLFVPALESLRGSFDKLIGHYRRYEMASLMQLCEKAGFKILESRYMDFLGIFPWWIKYRLLRSEKMEPALVNTYDRYFVPVIKRIETAIPPPIGKNLLVVAEKIEQPDIQTA